MEHEGGPEFYAREAGLLRRRIELLVNLLDSRAVMTADERQARQMEWQRLTDLAAMAARAWHQAGGRIHQVKGTPCASSP
jgi:hypothetical protein